MTNPQSVLRDSVVANFDGSEPCVIGIPIPARPNTPETRDEDMRAEMELAAEIAGDDAFQRGFEAGYNHAKSADEAVVCYLEKRVPRQFLPPRVEVVAELMDRGMTLEQADGAYRMLKAEQFARLYGHDPKKTVCVKPVGYTIPVIGEVSEEVYTPIRRQFRKIGAGVLTGQAALDYPAEDQTPRRTAEIHLPAFTEAEQKVLTNLTEKYKVMAVDDCDTPHIVEK